MYKPLTQNIGVGCLVWYIDSRIIPATSHKLRLLLAGPYRVDKPEIRPVYYPGEVKLVSLDVLKLYLGEDVVRQKPDDVDPDQYAEDGELSELLEVPWKEPERVYLETGSMACVPEPPIEHEIGMDLVDTPEGVAEREGIHES